MKVPVSLRLLGLILGATAFYTWVGSLVPQKEVRPPEVVKMSQDMTTDQMVAIGKGIFEGKGLCHTCHTIGKSGALRFPDLAGIATRAATRRPGLDAVSYIAQSIYQPSAFIVPGFNPGMPQIDKPPIALSDDEILAVVAFLQTLGGEPTVTMATKLPYSHGAEPTSDVNPPGGADVDAAIATSDSVAPPATGTVTEAGSATGAAALLDRYGCRECHATEAGGDAHPGRRRRPPRPRRHPARPGRPRPAAAGHLHRPRDAGRGARDDRVPEQLEGRPGMRLWVFLLAALALVVLGVAGRRLARVKISPLAWVVAWVAAFWLVLHFGFVVPVPESVTHIYMGIATLALLIYLTSDRERLQRAKGPLVAFLTERRFTPWLAAVVLLVPALVVADIYLASTAPPSPPAFGRTVHPAPPDQIMVHEQAINLQTLNNPYRHLETSDPAAFRQHLADGRRVYYENCFYCHGDLMRGAGMYASGLNPIPTNFQDPNTISQLQESFLFWRISKGGPGLPAEGGPWDSAMPQWEKFLSEEEMWNVILFLYDFTGNRPRARHETAVE